MRLVLEIGTTPAEEPCAQTTEPDYAERARAECRRFIREIRAALGPEPAGARLVVKSNLHDSDAGWYYEVAVVVDDDRDEAAVAYAFRCEGEAPARWSEASL